MGQTSWTTEGSEWPVAVMGGSRLDLEPELELQKYTRFHCYFLSPQEIQNCLLLWLTCWSSHVPKGYGPGHLESLLGCRGYLQASSWKHSNSDYRLTILLWHNKNIAFCHTPSASRAISCKRPVVPRSIPVLSSSSLSRNELAVEESERSVTCPTFMGRPASSKPFSCSRAFFAHSASANFMAKILVVWLAANNCAKYGNSCYRYEAIAFGSSCFAVHHELDSFNL